MKQKLLVLAVLSFTATFSFADGSAPHWTYGEVKEWGALAPAYAECRLGKTQSPIDIQTKSVQKANLSPIKTAYKTAAAQVINNGHTIQVNLTDAGTARVPSGEYQLLQFHFHTPSEETINGKPFPLVAHLVHKNAEGKLAVIAVLFKEGKENPALTAIFATMPAKEGEAKLATNFDATTLLPASLGYYAFTGSLTTPPCSEGVAWQVLNTPVEISKAQIEAFRKIYKNNARPVQPLNGRIVQESN
ncbi:carbonic anhydrase [Polynucleobacter sp. P1-05-14]|uniref:carbonic anhydrase n=1 Tax=Polynucleobacter sp. P1-05-14 TaxID=1819732 RepID=UPI001C0D14F2|nr:carbonic anhydrase family protein [Polynucleobacter sp. P1-05-14]MBU3548872.1 carbonic anhydrase family protein [Polynucleobacter sp. P1-05-14]